MFRNALQRGRDFVLGKLDVDRLTVKKALGGVRFDNQSTEAITLLQVFDSDGNPFSFDYNRNFGNLNVVGPNGTVRFQFEVDTGTLNVPTGGPNGTGEIKFANTRIYEDSNGEIVVEDSAGNTTTIS